MTAESNNLILEHLRAIRARPVRLALRDRSSKGARLRRGRDKIF
jgi:hypothetical protein